MFLLSLAFILEEYGSNFIESTRVHLDLNVAQLLPKSFDFSNDSPRVVLS